MRGTKAKQIRRAVYGDLSLRAPRTYTKTRNGEIVNNGPRGMYLRMKAAARHGHA